MKKLISLVFSMFLIGITGLALAQDTAAAPKPAHPRIHEVHQRMKMQEVRIEKGVQSGKLTSEQAQAMRAQLKAVQGQMEADYQANGKRELTEDQKAQLNQMLDQNSKAIYQDKHPNAGNGAMAAPPNGAPPASTN